MELSILEAEIDSGRYFCIVLIIIQKKYALGYSTSNVVELSESLNSHLIPISKNFFKHFLKDEM